MASLGVGCEGTLTTSRTSDAQAPSATGDGGTDGTGGQNGNDSGGSGAGSTAGDDAGSSSEADASASQPIAVRFFSVINQTLDTRFAALPSTLPLVRLLPQITLQAEVEPTVKSVRFTVDGEMRLDASAPFRFNEDEQGKATAWAAAVGEHAIEVEAYASDDGTGPVLDTVSLALELTAQGADATPEAGEHSVHRFWITDSGAYVHKDAGGNFVDQAGQTVLQAGDVSTENRGNGQTFFVSKPGLPKLEFAFIVLLPDGFDADVPYPVLLLLHHGSEDYRGTDSDDSLLTQPPLNGERSIIKSAMRHSFASIVLIPQLHFHDAIDGVNHEWAAFTSIDGKSGNSHSAPEPSVGARHALDVLDDLIDSTLLIDGKHTSVDTARLYMTGHSMGGLGSWDLVARQPSFWAAAVPMAGYPDHGKAAALVNTPIWAFHHRIDCYNAFAGSETMHRLITEQGGQRMRLSALDFDTGGACDQAHFQTPDRAFEDLELLPWLFSQVNDRL